MSYKFRDVLVADTRRLWPDPKREPPVLVLSERLNECQALGKTCHSLAATCCVHLERAEFARRRRRRADDCFASCAKRRPVDIELAPVGRPASGAGAGAKLGGKLVILALSRLQRPQTGDGDPDERPGAEYRCQRAWSWRFERFEPRQAGRQARRDHDHQTFYAKLASGGDHDEDADDNRWPPLQVDQLNITWNPSTGRELISMLVVPPTSKSWAKFGSFGRETLVSTELVCRHSNRTAKIHLLTLLNRQPRQVLNNSIADFRPPDTDSNGKANAGRRAIVLQATATSTSAGTGTGNTQTTTSPPSTGKASVVPPLPVKSRAASLLWAELMWDNLRAQLVQRSPGSQIGNGLLHLALGSLLVILIYTSCLLCLYLRGCRRRRPLTTEMKSKPRSAQPNISRPFNLQMPPATKTRLEMMIGASERDRLEASSAEKVKGTATRALPAPPPLAQLQRRPSAKRVVRAIRQAATATRFSRRGVRRRRKPSELLNVIPESSECSASSNFGEPRFNELVQQAMSAQCAHLKSSGLSPRPSRHRQQTRTLFASRPRLHLLAPEAALVSRNRILKQVKQDSSYD